MWTQLTPDALATTLSAREIEAYSRSTDYSIDVVVEIVRQVTATVRGFVLASGQPLAEDASTIPASLESAALDIVAHRLLCRFRVPIGEERNAAYRHAMELLQRVSEGKIRVSPPQGHDGPTTAMPAFSAPRPMRRLD